MTVSPYFQANRAASQASNQIDFFVARPELTASCSRFEENSSVQATGRWSLGKHMFGITALSVRKVPSSFTRTPMHVR